MVQRRGFVSMVVLVYVAHDSLRPDSNASLEIGPLWASRTSPVTSSLHQPQNMANEHQPAPAAIIPVPPFVYVCAVKHEFPFLDRVWFRSRAKVIPALPSRWFPCIERQAIGRPEVRICGRTPPSSSRNIRPWPGTIKYRILQIMWLGLRQI